MRTTPFHPFVHAVSDRQRHVAAGLWRLADPKIALASAVPFVAAVALAAEQRTSIDWPLVATAYAAIFLIEVGKNAVNDLCDFESDVRVRPEERSPFSGGKRVLVDRLLTRQDLWVISWIAFGAAGLIGLEVASRTSPLLLLLGMAAAAISIVYAEPPLKLSSRGLGELAVLLVYGPSIVVGTMMMLRAQVTPEALLASFSLGLLIANVLLINEVPDERADRAAGKRTLVVRMGRDRAETLFAIVFTLAFAVPVLVATYGAAPFRLVFFGAGIPTAAAAAAMLRRTKAGPPVAAQALTLATYAITGLAYASAVLLL